MSTPNRRSLSKEQFWRRLVRQWQRSGLSVRAFCAQHDLAEPTFYAWRRSLAQRDAAATTNGPAFLPVHVRAEPTPASATGLDATAPLEVVLASGRRLRVGVGFDGPTLRRLLALLEGGQPCC